MSDFKIFSLVSLNRFTVQFGLLKMHLRPTAAADIPRCTTIHDAAFEGNELSNFLAPDRAKYPLSWRQQALKVQHNKYYQPNTWSFVCVADTDDAFADVGEILGYAHWVRRASKEDAAADPWMRHMSVLERAEGWLRWAELKWEETLRINPAVSWARKDAFMRVNVASTGFAPIRATTHWYLDSLAVGPEYQRRGVARRLVDWGLQRALAETEERVPVGKAPVPVALISTAPGLHLYRSLGLKVVGWEDDSFLDVSADGGSNMVWDRTGYWIQDIEHEQPIKRGVVEAVYTTKDSRKHSASVS
jgi:ribosomal protein S18 acetylase RimI-like enzyme